MSAKRSTRRIDPAALVGSWLHSHEEDSGDERVYRPSDFAFPPSRGRAGFELCADGTLRERRLGVTDVPSQATGSWTLRDSSLVMDTPDGERTLDIVRALPDKLVVKR